MENHLSFADLDTAFRNNKSLLFVVVNNIYQVVYKNDLFTKYCPNVASLCFINPDIPKLFSLNQTGELHQGYITIGKRDSDRNISFIGKVYKQNNHLVFFMEKEDKKESGFNHKLVDLLRNNNDLQRDLIREKKKTDTQLEKIKLLNDEMNRFLGIAAHDLRNPIGLITSYADLLLEEERILQHEDLRTQINTMLERSEFSLNLINDLLDVSKIESGKLNLRKEQKDYHAFLKTVVGNLSFFQAKQKIDIVFDFIEGDYSFSFDPAKMEQVIGNIVTNALNYSPIESTIRIRTHISEGFINTSVIDEGPGIPEKMLEIIFKPFCITGNKPSGPQKSTGLGLTIVKKIIESHGGTIKANNNQNGGACFTFSLPLNTGEIA